MIEHMPPAFKLFQQTMLKANCNPMHLLPLPIDIIGPFGHFGETKSKKSFFDWAKSPIFSPAKDMGV